ncbi:MAG: hypothetical protein COA79_17880 [Planctomycetota bacterium]|nr:MAG: hypothetical protein COA79_17880 [Planctomycetota bacterium]
MYFILSFMFIGMLFIPMFSPNLGWCGTCNEGILAFSPSIKGYNANVEIPFLRFPFWCVYLFIICLFYVKYLLNEAIIDVNYKPFLVLISIPLVIFIYESIIVCFLDSKIIYWGFPFCVGIVLLSFATIILTLKKSYI